MSIYNIYKAKNTINNKCYIGFATNFRKRQNSHKKRFQTGKSYFYTALRKYGWDNFEWSILYQSKDKDYTKNVMENHFITEYRTFIGFEDCNGYNMTMGGDGSHGFSHSIETRTEMSKTRIGKNVGPKKIVSCKLYNPKGILYEIKDLRKFCEGQNLNYNGMLGIVKSKNLKQNFGWMKYEEGYDYNETLQKYYNSKKKYKLWEFYSPEGEYISFHNLDKFCLDNNLDRNFLKPVHSRPTGVYMGYIKYIKGISFDERWEYIRKYSRKNKGD